MSHLYRYLCILFLNVIAFYFQFLLHYGFRYRETVKVYTDSCALPKLLNHFCMYLCILFLNRLLYIFKFNNIILSDVVEVCTASCGRKCFSSQSYTHVYHYHTVLGCPPIRRSKSLQFITITIISPCDADPPYLQRRISTMKNKKREGKYLDFKTDPHFNVFGVAC